MKKRYLSLLLAFVLCLSLLPMAALAASDEPTAEPVEEPAEEPAVEPAEEPAEEPVEETAEEPAEEPVEEPAEKSIEEPVEESALESDAEPAAVALDGAGAVIVLTSANIETEGENKGLLVLQMGQSYKLGEDIAATVIIQGEGTNPAVLDLDGHVLTATQNSTNIIGIKTGMALIVRDGNSGKQTRKFSVNSSGCWIRDETTGTKTVTGGMIYGEGKKQGVLVKPGASFTLESGSIVGCSAALNGAGVYIEASIGSSYGSFTMSGGSIRGCVAQSAYGGGVFAGPEASFTMSDGEISDCHAGYGGCALSGNKDTKFILTGGTIGACTKSGCKNSGVDVSDQGTFMFAHGGTVKASVLVNKYSESSFESSFGSITSDPNVYGYAEGKTTAFYGKVTNKGTVSSGIYYDGLDSTAGTISGKTITFKNGDAEYAVEVVGEGRKSIAPIAPTPAAEYLAFEGWYTDKDTFQNKYTFGSTLSDNITLYAKFETKPATCTAPTANDLTYTGTEQPLVTAGTAEHGTMMYCLTQNGTYASAIPTAKDAGTYTVYYYAKGTGGYGNSAVSSVPVTIDPKPVRVSGITAEDKTYDGGLTATLKYDAAAFDGKVDGDTLTVSATGTFADKDVGEDRTVSISNLTLGGEDADNYVLAATGQQTETTADIAPKPVTLQSASNSKAYDGTALTNETVTVTAGGMVTGETLDYDFTGTQTAIGSSQNTFTAKDSAMAKASNYAITYNYGTLTVSLPANVGDAVKDMTEDNVTSDDRKTIEDTQKTVEDYLAMDPTDAEKKTLEDLKAKLEGLLARLDEVKAAMEDEVITGTDDITKDNVKTSDKKALEDAKAAIEKLLEDYDGNLTADEKQTLGDKLERIGDALDEIARLEKAEKDAKNKPVKTGDEATPVLWIVVAIVAVAAVVILLVMQKKKK